MTATVMEVDFSSTPDAWQQPSGNPMDGRDLRPVNEEGKLLTPKQIRARARRRLKRGAKNRQGAVTKEEFEALYKPIEEWDLDELARGRPRNSNGDFRGRTPGWITREVHEKAMEKFTLAIKTEMGTLTPTALKTLEWVLDNDQLDDKGKPVIPASAKNQAAMFLIEHLVGKPKQHVQQDISVKLQGILSSVMVNPNMALASPSQGGSYGDQASDTPGYTIGHLPGHTIPMGVEEELEDEDIEDAEVVG